MLEYLELLKEIFIVDSRYKYILEGLIFSISTTALAAIIGIVLGIVLAIASSICLLSELHRL